MKLIKTFKSGSVFISFTAEKTFLGHIKLSNSFQSVIYKHLNKNAHGEPDGRWKFDYVAEPYDSVVVHIGDRKLEDRDAKTFLAGNKAAGIDYEKEFYDEVEKEVEIMGADEIASKMGVIINSIEALGKWYIRGGCKLAESNITMPKLIGDATTCGYFKDENGNWDYEDMNELFAMGYKEISIKEYLMNARLTR